ncbi:MAG: DUF47 family protein [Candidatus Bathyarchaeia archaeon]
MSKLESWFAGRRVSRAVMMIREHSKMTVDAVELLVKCIKAAAESKVEEQAKSFDLLRKREKEADALRKEIVADLSKGELPVDERRGLLRLARQIDWVADWAHESGRILSEFSLASTPLEVRAMAVKMAEVVRECTLKLDDCIAKLVDRRIPESLQAADQVEAYEEEVDRLYQEARGLISKLDVGGRLTVGSIILLAQLMDAIENTADRCEDTCDQVRVIAVTFTR